MTWWEMAWALVVILVWALVCLITVWLLLAWHDRHTDRRRRDGMAPPR